jgi:Undecaprenyl-phosphate galactose phosphotransferase WbaP
MENAESVYTKLEAAAPRREAISAHSRMVLAMLASDVTGILTAVLLAGAIRWVFLGPMTLSSFVWVPAYIAVFILSAALRGLYPATGLSAVEQFRNTTIAISILTLVIIAGTFVFKVSSEFSRLVLGLTWLLGIVTVPFNRTVIRHFMAMAGIWGEPVAIVGNAREVEHLTSYYRSYPKIGLKPEVTITLSRRVGDLTAGERDHLIRGLRKMNAVSNIRIVMVVYEKMDEFSAIREIFRDLFERVVMVNPADSGDELGGVTVREYGAMLSFEVSHTLMDRSAQIEKRVIDVLIAGLGLLMISPILGCIALVIALDSPGGVFYRQRRLGKGGREFSLLKFRTMYRGAANVLNTYLQKYPDRRAEWDKFQKLKDDPRITRFGRFLRRFSLDELPQLGNVLIGEMSLVGPRPIMVNQREMYGPNFQHYVRVLPGITGMWQISGRNHTSFATRTAFDVRYVMNWSVWVDVYIMVRTAWVLLRRDGAN